MVDRRQNKAGNPFGEARLEDVCPSEHSLRLLIGRLSSTVISIANHGGNSRVHEDRRLYKRFKELNPTAFSGTPDPMIAEKWMKQLEKIFNVMRYPEDKKVTLAAFMIEVEVELSSKKSSRSFFQTNQKSEDIRIYGSYSRRQVGS